MKRILLLTHTNRLAGAERMVRVLFDAAQAVGLDVRMAVLRFHPSGTLLQPHENLKVRQILFGSFDVIHTHLFWPALLIRLKRLFGARFYWIHTVHYAQYRKLRIARFKYLMDRFFILPSPEVLVAVSPSVMASLERFPNRRLIENETSYLSPEPPPRRIKASGEKILLGTIAMLRSEKGVDDLIGMMKILKAKDIPCELRVAGEGPERANLTAQITRLGLNAEVKLLGYVNDGTKFLSDLDIYLNAAHAESYGLALVEALHAGLPMIAPDIDHIPNLLGGGQFGRIVPRGPRFVSELSRTVEEVAQDLKLWSERARAGYEAYRKLSHSMRESYLELYAKTQTIPPGVCMIAPFVTHRHALGGIQRQMKLQSKELSRLGHKVFILQRRDFELTPERQEQTGWGHVEFLQVSDPFAVGAESGSFFLRLRGLSFIVFGVLKVFQNRRRIQILHAHQLFSPTLLGFICCKILGLPFVVKVTASGRLGEMSQLKKMPFYRLRRWTFRAISQAIVLTDEMLSEVSELGLTPSQITLLPNCVDAPAITPRAVLEAQSDTLQVLYCGRLSSEKCLHILLEAGVLLAQRGLRTHLRLVGGGQGSRDQERELRAQAEKLPPLCTCEFVGQVEEVAKYYRSADVFVLPSNSEGMSNALLEALSFGVPCIASDIPANRFVVTHNKDGLLFVNENAKSLAEALEQIHRDPELAERLSRQALETVAARFSPRAIAQRISSIYTAALHLGEPHL